MVILSPSGESPHKEIRENDLKSVVFADPFTDPTRRAKRNLLVAAFVAIMIAALNLRVSGFLGLEASPEELGNDIAQGLACLLTLYFLVSFTVQAFVDYNAWQFQRERQMTKPYLDLVNLVVSRASVTGEQIKNACDGLVELKATSGFEKKLDSALGQLKSIEKSLGEFLENTQPLLTHWAGTIRSMDRLNARLRVRFISLWTLDIVLPVALGALAIYATRSGIGSLMFRIAG